MKVAYLLGSLNRGGTETLLLDVFQNAEKAPYEIICVHRKGGAYLDAYNAAGQKVICCSPKRFGLFRYLRQLRQILLSEKITHIHAQQPIDCIFARLATVSTRIRIVATFHGYDFGARRFDKLFNAISIRMADAVCFVSKAQKDYYIKNYHIKQLDKLHVVYNGIDFTKLNRAEKDDRIRGLEDEKVKLCMVGNFVKGRSPLIIAKAIKIVNREKQPPLDFYFIGRRDDKEIWRYDECVKYCEENKLTNVHFLGARSDVPELLKKMDGFVYSTVHDTFGIAVVEAMAAGLPVVVNDWEVIREVCGEENLAMRYYKTGDPIDCAKAIKSLLEELDESKKVAKENEKNIRKKYAIQEHIHQLYNIYAKL